MKKFLKIIFITITGVLLMSPVIFKYNSEIGNNQPHIVQIKLKFHTPPSYVNVSKATLKYDKDFAYSLTLDDGLDDAYTAAFPLFNGGLVEGNGQTYPGLYYSDGCGNKIPFRAGLAWHTANPQGQDLHEIPGYMTWDQLIEVYNSGWNVMNHSYAHANGPGTNYNFQITENYSYVKAKTGINMTHFVIPQGDVNYANYVFDHNIKAVYSEPGFPHGNGLVTDNLTNLDNFRLRRQLITNETENLTANINRIATESSPSTHYWYNEFTHRVGFNHTGGSLIFSAFESYMKHIEENYGFSGTDRVWMAPLQDVYEYLSVRNSTPVEGHLIGNEYIINLDFAELPDDFEKYALTLLVDTDQDFNDLEINSEGHMTFNGSGEKKLINVEWNEKPLNNGEILGLNSSILNQDLFEIFPVPATDKIEVLMKKGSGNYVYSIIDNQGKVVSSGKVKGENKVHIDLEELSLENGTYFIKVLSREYGSATKPIIIAN